MAARREELLGELQVVSLRVGSEDEVCWRPKPRSEFTVRSCYAWWSRNRPRVEEVVLKYEEIWLPKIPLKA
ncbi:hypothetical protein QJS10_CPB12g00886 [Acorus calamus]|uniref:Uncharacterized protein n=1 Tax=Acorus calamus TaxID=4465 RepID=A0AAV9DPD4_ACOCL|nr:hypothetical protein QJS10_CPB12g00886 [Acorus calamus]